MLKYGQQFARMRTRLFMCACIYVRICSICTSECIWAQKTQFQAFFEISIYRFTIPKIDFALFFVMSFKVKINIKH